MQNFFFGRNTQFIFNIIDVVIFRPKPDLVGSLHIVVGKRKERIAHQNLLSSSRTGSSFSIRWKGSKNLVKTNPQPGVLTALALARIKVCCKFEEWQFYNCCSEFFAVQIGVQPSMGEILVARASTWDFGVSSVERQRVELKKVIILTVREGFQFNAKLFLRTEYSIHF